MILRHFAAAILLAALATTSVSAQSDDNLWSRHDRGAMIRRIDRLMAEWWAEAGVEPAAMSSDAEFLRRVYLDLTGEIPRVSDVRRFLADPAPDKRARLIDRLVMSAPFATHMADTWRSVMLPGGLSPEELQNLAGVQNWLREQFVQEMRYDRMVADLLVSSGGGDAGPALYYTAMELKPEKLAASTARIFLGLQIECAECHDHPFDRWTQQDFWRYAAFFARLSQGNAGMMGTQLIVDQPTGEVTLPDTDNVMTPKYPGGSEANADALGTRRVQLAIWMASRDNPYLARAAANRVWAKLFGKGLVEPVDDLGPTNPPSHPQLFEELAVYFVDTGFDLKELFRTLANTRAYQLSSQYPQDTREARDVFACMAIKPLTAEQLYDSLNRTLMRQPQPFGPFGGGGGGRLFDPRRLAFVGKMASTTRSAIQYDAGVPQALTIMNGSDTGEATDIEQSRILRSIETPLFDDYQRLDVLFMATLSRLPSAEERSEFLQYVMEGEAAGDRRQALSDVLWALLNSAEFALNH